MLGNHRPAIVILGSYTGKPCLPQADRALQTAAGNNAICARVPESVHAGCMKRDGVQDLAAHGVRYLDCAVQRAADEPHLWYWGNLPHTHNLTKGLI